MKDETPPGALLARLDEVEITIEKLVAGGEGLGRYESIPLFVPRSAPGDRLRVRIVARKPDYGRAEIVEILEAGPGRREPPCPYFVRCGGCDLQHLEDRRQVELKAEAVRETLQRLGGLELPADTEIVAGPMWGYRLRTQLHTRVREGKVEVGYFERGTNDLVPVLSCPILRSELERVLPGLPDRLGEDPPRRLDLLMGEEGLSSAPVTGDLPHGEVTIPVAGYRFVLDARCFFQAHTTLAARLMDEAVGEWEGERAVDLYAGVGLFSVPLSRRYRELVAVEGDRIAARYARKNARGNDCRGLRVEARAVESWVRYLDEGLDRVLVDPPRAGLGTVVRKALLRARPRRLTYVSCHAATFARDLRELGAAYRLESLRLLDLFPQSGHMEVVGQLVAAAA